MPRDARSRAGNEALACESEIGSLLQTAFNPSLSMWPDAGVYQLRLRVGANLRITVGRLGQCTFPAGDYVYTGRASRGLRARVLRHVEGPRTEHWHIDYLLTHRRVRVLEVVLASRDPSLECAVHQQMGEDAECVVPGFGASDCKAKCDAHLVRMVADRVSPRTQPNARLEKP